MSQPSNASTHRLLLSCAVYDLLDLQKRRRRVLNGIESRIDPNNPETCGTCLQATLHLIRQEKETAREIQRILESLARLAPAREDRGEGFCE